MRVKYGYLTIIEGPVIKKENGQHRKIVTVKCKCGKVKKVMLHNLRCKKHPTRSCGCRKKEKGRLLKHGLTYHPLYKIWSAIKDRCGNSNNKDYKDYGGRGISMCVSWQNSFRRFYNWCIKNGYAKGLELDREQNDDGYRPSNCRFVTHAVNMSNRRKFVKKPPRLSNVRPELEDYSSIEIVESETTNYF